MKELLLGWGTELANRGEHTLKGIDGSWVLYEVLSSSP
jgi:hypothetical protein